MATSKPELFTFGEGWWDITVPLAPAPASRVRVGKHGSYYTGRYAQWRKDAYALMKPYVKDADPVGDPLHAVVVCACKRPANPSNQWPIGDVDNYAKAALDLVTASQLVWFDDKQLVTLHSYKRFARTKERPNTRIIIATNEEFFYPAEGGDDVYDLPDELRIPYTEE